MSKKETHQLTCTCDKCGTTETVDIGAYPESWVSVTLKSKQSTIALTDLCWSCYMSLYGWFTESEETCQTQE